MYTKLIQNVYVWTDIGRSKIGGFVEEVAARKVFEAMMRKDDESTQRFIDELKFKATPDARNTLALFDKHKPVEICQAAMNAMGFEVRVDNVYPRNYPEMAEFYCHIYGADGSETVGTSHGNTKDEAICLAALKAVGVEI